MKRKTRKQECYIVPGCPNHLYLLKDKPILTYTYAYIVVLKIVKNKQHYVGNE